MPARRGAGSPYRPRGDTHNFGRRVTLEGDRIHKPRTVVWEWLLLSAESPLRRLLDEAAAVDGLGHDAFRFLPDLAFVRSESPDVPSEVERIELAPLPELTDEERRALARIVGRSIALWSWLGVSDLHWENLVLGMSHTRRMVFAPLDIEMILAELSLPTETKLLPDADPEYADLCRHAAGVRRVLPYLGKPLGVGDVVAVAAAYRSTLAFLDRHAAAIGALFAGLPAIRETPIRICLRSTEEYVGGGSATLWPPLLEAEAEQLARGDIPYFFRFYDRPGIHYYAEPSLTRTAMLPSEGDVPQLDPMLSISKGLRSPSRKKLREEGLFTLLGAFDDASFTGGHEEDGLEVTFRRRTVVVTFPSGEQLESRRDLRAFVGSVYLPCRCGEVRSVFVPAVTACNAGD